MASSDNFPPLVSIPASPPGLTADLSLAGAPVVAPASKRFITFLVIATFGISIAFITPLGISLAIRVQQLAPGHAEYLGFITGGAGLLTLLTSPFIGIASDRTRSRLGRRRPFITAGVVLGLVALVVMAFAPSIWVLGVGWVLALLGWGTSLSNLNTSAADRLSEGQRGKVAGLTGFAIQIAPVVGIAIAGVVSSDNFLLFMIPGAVGALLAILFVILVPEPDSREMTFPERLNLKGVLRKYVYNPRKYPDFSWNWLGRFLFYFGLTFNTTFAAFFVAQRLHREVADVAGIVAVISLAGVVATALGAVGGGFLSDRLKRRRIFVLGAGVVFAVGAVTMAFAQDLTFIIVGSSIIFLAIGVYSAVDQALLLDVLPERATDAGRFMSIMNFASSIPQSVAPLIAPAILLIGAVGSEKNYTVLYIVAGGFTVAAGFVMLKIRAVR